MSDFAPDRLDEPPAANLASEQFNDRMAGDGLPFRLVRFVGGQIALTGDSYHLRAYTPGEMTEHETLLDIRDVPDEVAARVAEAFVAGWRFARRQAEPPETSAPPR